MRGLRGLFSIVSFCVLAMVTQGDDYTLVARTDGDPGYSYHTSPVDWRDVNMYQIFTDRFFDGNNGNNTARYSGGWYNGGNSSAENDRHLFQGGDWAGIQQKLGYLSGMGVNCIWISGVQLNEQGSDTRFTPYHAYHPHDFYKVEPMFGTFAELKSLIDAAHAQGIYVVLDVVVNHMADRLKYNDNGGNHDGYNDWGWGSMSWWNDNVKFAWPFDDPSYFHNHGDIGDSDWDTYPKYVLGSFLGTEDLRTEDAYVQNHLKDIFKHLIDSTDCDGFRVDAIKHMEYDFIKGWANDMRQHAAWRGKTNFLLFGEYFSYDDGTQASYCKDPGYSFNSTLWFPMQMTMKNVFAYEQGTTQLADRMNAMGQYGEAADKLVAFMDNHDVDRFALECGSSWEAKMRPALTFLYTALPVPCLFYGTEHGFNQGERRNGSPKLAQADFQRECMMDFGYQWGNAYGDKFYDSPLYLHVQKLNELRGRFISLRRGGITQRWSEGGKGLFAISRVDGDEEALVAINTDWGSKSCNPEVSKPDGTTFVNVLNESETIDVSGGRLSFSVEGKGSKIFVAGPGGSEVNVSCDTVTLTVTYTPNDGPLSGVDPIYIGIGHDGSQDVMNVAMTPSGDDWAYGYAISNATNWVNFWFHDNGTPTYDNNGGENWNIDITQCGRPQVDLSWIGNSYHWPDTNEWDVGEELWVNTETYPQDAVSSGFVTYSTDGGGSWTNMPLSFNGKVDNNDTWHANLGAYPGGTTVQFALNVTGRNTNLWDNNGGGDYSISVNPGASTVTWVGNTSHWPEDGNIEPGDDLWVNIESFPVGAGTNGSVVYSTDGGASWLGTNLEHNGIANDHDRWHANLGGFPAETTLQYAVKVEDGDGTDHWDNNGGPNFTAVVNEAPSSIRWFGNAIQAGTAMPRLGIDQPPTGGVCRINMGQLTSNAIYTLQRSIDLVTWSNLNSLTAGATTDVTTVSTDGSGATFYRLQLDWAPGPAVYENEQAVISVESWPAGGALSATLVYSVDGDTNWNARPMRRSGRRGNNDIWSTSLGAHPIGAGFQYAIELKDGNGDSLWVNNDTANYRFSVLDPNVSDFEAPTTDYSPHDTTASEATLDVTLSATDDQDPSPDIFYTTDGSTPTTGSSVYGSAIHVTDQGSGVDMTIKFFARDAAGNTSDVTSVDVKVNESFNYGGSQPYSTNPTLGAGVANGTITVDGSNSGEWGTNKLIAIDMANDDPRSLGSNWTMHEAPVDFTHLWAAWDDTNLYIAWQLVDVTDVVDPSNAGSGDVVTGNDGILQWIAIDTIAGQGAELDMWGKNKGEAYWTGEDKPDFQIYIASSLWQGYISEAVDGVFPVDDGGVNYFTMADAGIQAANGNSLVATDLWGTTDVDNRHDGGSLMNFATSGHSNTSRDSFYEMSIPLSHLGLTRGELEANGIGVMIGMAVDTVPHDEATLDSSGVEVWNSSLEWGDSDALTSPFSRVGSWK